jgi:hypothetical protein
MKSEAVSMDSELGELGTAVLEGALYRLLKGFQVSSMTSEEQALAGS